MESYELQQNTYAVEEQNRLLAQQAAELATQNE